MQIELAVSESSKEVISVYLAPNILNTNKHFITPQHQVPHFALFKNVGC